MAKQTFTTGQVLTAAQVNSLQANDFNQTVSVKTANYTLAAADKGTRIEFNTSGSVTCTVNSGLFDAGDTLVIQNRGAGTATITAGTATVNTSASLALAQYSAGTLYFVSDSAALFFGDAAGISASIVDAKGDLIVGTADNTVARLAVGTNGHTLVADSAETTGLKWAAPASGSTFSGASAYNNATQSISNTTWTKVTWNQERYDTDSYHSTSSNTDRFTAPAGKSGYYQATVGCRFASNSTGRRIGRFQTNVGTPDVSWGAVEVEAASAGSALTYLNLTWTIYLAAGDYVWYEVYQTSGGSLNLENTNTDSGFMITYLGA